MQARSIEGPLFGHRSLPSQMHEVRVLYIAEVAVARLRYESAKKAMQLKV